VIVVKRDEMPSSIPLKCSSEQKSGIYIPGLYISISFKLSSNVSIIIVICIDC
jgi:hypothetical protein